MARQDVRIDAIDIDEASAVEAAANFRNSPWSESLQAFHASLDGYTAMARDREYDLIFSNPPYFEDSMNAPEERRNNARHTSTGLSYREILDFAASHLSAGGRVSLVLPAETENALCRHARMNGLHLFRIVRVRTVPRKAPSRIIAEFSRIRIDSPEDVVLTIQNEGKYTEEYLSLMHELYLFA
jgi:tRNA1Val (adenine37-N6)-methyltransferase